jgi:hypothetical protein
VIENRGRQDEGFEAARSCTPTQMLNQPVDDLPSPARLTRFRGGRRKGKKNKRKGFS